MLCAKKKIVIYKNIKKMHLQYYLIKKKKKYPRVSGYTQFKPMLPQSLL